MHWIIQSNLVGAEDADRLREALTRLDTPYTDVRLIPVVVQLEHVPVVEGPVFVYGSTFVHRAAYDQGWWPGYIGGTTDYAAILDGFGAEEMLNGDVVYSRLGDLKLDGPMFVRPDDDGKLFTGCVVHPDEVEALLAKVARENHAQREAILDARVVVSSPKQIFAEHRCLVVNGQVVTASTYRRGQRVVREARVDEGVLAYAQAQVDRFNPELGFAMDIAETEAGMKIIELNALSSSGLYACDLLRFVDAVNALDGLRPAIAAKAQRP